MDTICIEFEGDRIVLSFHREVGEIRKVRYLSDKEALVLGLLLIAEAPEEAINLDVTSHLSVQIMNAPYEEAFLSVIDPFLGRTFVVHTEGDTVRQIGQQLLLLAKSENRNVSGFVRQISHSYLDDHQYD